MSAQIIPFPRSTIRICRLNNGRMEFRTIAGIWTDCPRGWSVVCRRVNEHKGFVA
jgi:hypothetical protein